jgi:lipopolysaccharide/colanic/teichoic acid biosynthesis glycosyltransferase
MLAKRIFDLFVTVTCLIFLLPLFLVIAVWIKLDSPGPIIFQQTRIGQFGKEFIMYKFRTMVVNAEAIGKQLTLTNDERITRSGKFLRKYTLDELPQLFNIFKGEMSLVGPRPELPKYVEYYTAEQRQVLEVLPGITDLASIKFRNEMDLITAADNPEVLYIQEILPQKLGLHLQYIAQSSLFFDLQIILKTLWQMFRD